jgi:hypothetical protein
MRRSIISALSLFLLVLADAQKTPSPYIPQYTFDVSYRQNVTGRHDSSYNGTFELRDALGGFEMNSLITASEYFHLDENGAIDEKDQGLVTEILDELANRGSFTWRNSFAATDGPEENRARTEVEVEAYDVSADSWRIHSAERFTQGIGFPEGFLDSSLILVGFKLSCTGYSPCSSASLVRKLVRFFHQGRLRASRDAVLSSYYVGKHRVTARTAGLFLSDSAWARTS